jgi:hypothetical protein
MQKKLSVVLLLVALLALFAAMAVAPNPVKSFNLVALNYVKNELKVHFLVTGINLRTELPAGITIDHVSYRLFCEYDGARHVTCSAPNMNRNRGKQATIWVAGFIFYPRLPAILWQAPVAAPTW